jgi:hypothetical protein
VTSDDSLEDQLNEAVREANNVDSMNPAPSRIIDTGNVVDGIISTANNTVIPISAAWDSLLDKIALFTKIVDGSQRYGLIADNLPSHHMYMVCVILGPSVCQHGMVYLVLCAQGSSIMCTSRKAYLTSGQMIIAQKDRDHSIHGLAEIMADTYAFVDLAEPLKKIDSQKLIMLSLVQQRLE